MENSLVWARAIERDILAVGAFFCLWLSYKFQQGNGDGSASLAWKGFKVELKKIGPSIFFALLGTSIIIASITSNLQISKNNNNISVRYATPAERDRIAIKMKEVTAKIRSLAGYSGSIKQNNVTPQERETLVKIIADLQEFKPDLFEAAFGSGTFAKYSDYVQRCSDVNNDECVRLGQQFDDSTLSKMRAF